MAETDVNPFCIFLASLGMHTIAAQLLGSGAAINDPMSDGQTLLHMAIQRQDSKSALFLLEHQADINVRYQPSAEQEPSKLVTLVFLTVVWQNPQ